MDSWLRERLSAEQAIRVSEWIPDICVLSDMSWNLVDTVVLEAGSGGQQYVIKAAGPANHHIGREIDAHLTATSVLASTGRAARMVHYDRSANLLVTEYLDGTLALNTESEFDRDIHRQAGEVLRTFHSQNERLDDDAVREAISAVWAYQVGDQPFEQQGLRMIDDALRLF